MTMTLKIAHLGPGDHPNGTPQSTHGKQGRHGGVNYFTPSEKIKKYEEGIMGRNTEKAALFDKYGNVIFEKDGDNTSVSFSDAEISQFAGLTLTHNHPRGGSFSIPDIMTLMNTDLLEIRAVTPNDGTYVLRSTPNMVKYPTRDILTDFLWSVKIEVDKRGYEPWQEEYATMKLFAEMSNMQFSVE